MWEPFPRKGTHKNEERLRPEIILGRIDSYNKQSVYPQGANSGSSLWVVQYAFYQMREHWSIRLLDYSFFCWMKQEAWITMDVFFSS